MSNSSDSHIFVSLYLPLLLIIAVPFFYFFVQLMLRRKLILQSEIFLLTICIGVYCIMVGSYIPFFKDSNVFEIFVIIISVIIGILLIVIRFMVQWDYSLIALPFGMYMSIIFVLIGIVPFIELLTSGQFYPDSIPAVGLFLISLMVITRAVFFPPIVKYKPAHIERSHSEQLRTYFGDPGRYPTGISGGGFLWDLTS